MKRFIVTVLSVSVFFIGLGGLFEKASASLKSDEKALEIIGKARRAIGGDASIGGVKSMTILGKATKTFELESTAKSEQGDFEINFELPNRMSKNINIGAGDGNKLMDKKVDVVVMRKGDGDNLQWKTQDGNGDGVKKFTIVKKDGTTDEIKTDGKSPIILKRTDGETVVTDENSVVNSDGKKIFIRKADGLANAEFARSNELFRTTLALLLTAPEGLDVSYTYIGEGSVDGTSCDIIAANDGGSTIKLYLDKSNSLPRMMTFQGHKPMIVRIEKGANPESNSDVKVFSRTMDKPEMAEFQVKFSDFRSVGGLQLPFKWTQTIGGKDDEVLDVTSYEVNPANIAEKFKEVPTQVFLRMKKEQ